MKRKRAKLKRTRRRPSLHRSLEQQVAKRRSERKNASQGVPRNGKVGRGIEVRAEKRKENILRRHLSEKRSTGKTRRLGEKNRAHRRTIVA